MDYYGQGNSPSALGKNATPQMTVDKACKLLRAAKPLVWSTAIVLGLLGVTLTIRYLWMKRDQDEERVVSGGNIWTRT
jgi:hypothetical protein